MRKIILPALLLIPALILPACGAGRSGGAAVSELYDKGLGIVSKMDAMAESEEYILMMTGSGEIRDIVGEIGSGDYAKPEAVFKIEIPDSAVVSFYQTNSDYDIPAKLLPDAVSRYISGIAVRVNGLSGASAIAATSVISVGECFVCKELKQNTMFLYIFENGYSAAVSFIPGSDGAVAAAGSFLVDRGLNADSSEEDIKTWLEEASQLSGCTISSIKA